MDKLSIQEMIDKRDENVLGINRLFGRFTHNNIQVREEIEKNNEKVRNQVGITVEKGKIKDAGNRIGFNERRFIYANIGGKSIQIGYTDCQSYDNGKLVGVFHGIKGTKFASLKGNFTSQSLSVLQAEFYKWIYQKASELYPDDYEASLHDEERYEGLTGTTGINFLYFRIGEGVFNLDFSIGETKFHCIPVVEQRNGKYQVYLDFNEKKWIAKNQFKNLVVGNDMTLLTAIGNMIESFVLLYNGSHKGVKSSWSKEDFQELCMSFSEK